MKFGTTVGDDIIVSAFDDIGPAKLYIKFESEEWFSSENNYTISKTELPPFSQRFYSNALLRMNNFLF